MRRSIFEPGPGKWDQDEVQANNIRRVLTSIASNPFGTAADAGRATGLSPATMSRLVGHLVDRQLVIEGDRVRGKRGQPGVALCMNSEGAYSVGCQIGYGSSTLFLRSLGGAVVAEQAFSIDSCAVSHIVGRVTEAFRQVMANQPPEVSQRMVGIGVACPADFGHLFDTAMGKSDAGVWDERSFQAELERSIKIRATIYGTGGAGAWAELAVASPPRPADYLYVFVDRFVYSGLLLHGRLWSGPQDRPGSIGRTMLGNCKGLSRLYDLPAADPAKADWVSLAAKAIAEPSQVLCDSLDLPLVIIDGSVPTGLLDSLVDETAQRLKGMSWDNPPHVRRGKAGHNAPAKGAALRPIYLDFFADGTE